MRKLIKESEFDVINQRLLEIKQKSLSGTLKIKSNHGLDWSLNFRLGRLGWVTGGSNYQERWQRHLRLYCSANQQPEVKKIISQYSLDKECSILLKLQGHRYITRQELSSLMVSIAAEVMFDVIQYVHTTNSELSYEFDPNNPNSKLNLLLPLQNVEEILVTAKHAWEKWQTAGLINYSPNLFPVLKQSQIWQEEISASPYGKVAYLINGSLSLRSLAIKSHCNLIALTEYIVSREAKGAIAFSPIATESKIQFTNPQQASNNSSSSSIQQPLVICVDDSPLICQAMANILLTEGYRFMSIQQPEKVIVTILKQKPNFIFLDLLMPIVNGYELCAQIRRTPKLQAIPIVILTAKDGLVDRMRAKLSGSTDFMSKPVDKKSVIAMLNKYLTVKV